MHVNSTASLAPDSEKTLLTLAPISIRCMHRPSHKASFLIGASRAWQSPSVVFELDQTLQATGEKRLNEADQSQEDGEAKQNHKTRKEQQKAASYQEDNPLRRILRVEHPKAACGDCSMV